MNEQKIILQKDGLTFKKEARNHYTLHHFLENENIIMEKIIDFSLIKLVYDLNPDVYMKSSVNKLNENQATIFCLLNHFFEDFGLPQRYSHVHCVKKKEGNIISFKNQTIYDKTSLDLPEEAEIMPLRELDASFTIINDHKIEANCEVKFDPNLTIPIFAEKMIGVILLKVFKRLKQFIEKINI